MEKETQAREVNYLPKVKQPIRSRIEMEPTECPNLVSCFVFRIFRMFKLEILYTGRKMHKSEVLFSFTEEAQYDSV